MSNDPLTPDEFKSALPEKMKKSVNQQLIDAVNKTLSEPELFEQYRDNLLSYGHIMKDGKFKVEQYINAVKYVSYKLMGKTNIDAYSLTFPDKIQRFMQNAVSDKDIASYVAAYNKSKLVGLLLEQTMIPVWVLNQENYQKAINKQVELMTTATSEKVQTEAANSLLTHLKPPETKKVELSLGASESKGLDDLRKVTEELVTAQREALKAGAVNADEVAKSRLTIDVDAEVVD